MNIAPLPTDFEQFRLYAKSFLAHGTPPSALQFRAEDGPLFATRKPPLLENVPTPFSISKNRLRWMRLIALHRADDTWDLLYRLLWKLRENGYALENPIDPDVIDAERRARQVSRDIHKMHAFVRFHKTTVGERQYFVAWHQPQHKILRAAVPFFKRRFAAMRWSILTPDESVHWDLEKLSYGEKVLEQPSFDDDFEKHWLTYYSSIFNPARIKIQAMKNEMPVRYWHSMPETKLINSLIAAAPARLEKMREAAPIRATVPEHSSLAELREACHSCTACPIACLGGKAVFGDGPTDARIVFVGEQPGDEEDLSGKPFAGPAGQLLSRVMNECGIERSSMYLTNAVKHFKWTPRGKRRIHQKPVGAEILACKPWLSAELAMLRPELIVCLGVSAAQAVLGLQMTVKKELDNEFEGPKGARVLITYHPSAALRAPTSEKREEIVQALRATMQRVKSFRLSGEAPPNRP